MMPEHNHGKFWYGYIVSLIPLGAAIFLVSNLWYIEVIHEPFSALFILGVIAMLTIATVLMFKGINEKRNECQICRKN